MEMTSYASVLTITSFTVERYMAICRPLHAHRMVGLSRCVKIVILIWLIALLAALPYAIHTRVFYELYHPETNEPIAESLICNIRKEWRVGMTYMFQVSTFLFFVSPVTLIVVLYILIGIALRKSSLARDYSDDKPNYMKCGRSRTHSNSMTQPRRVIIRMLGELSFLSDCLNKRCDSKWPVASACYLFRSDCSYCLVPASAGGPPFFFPQSRTEEPAKAGTCARDRRALQQLALNVHVKHPDLT